MSGRPDKKVSEDTGSLRRVAALLLSLADGDEAIPANSGEDDLPQTRGATVKRLVRSPLPDPRLIRRILRDRQARTRFFDPQLFGDPAWDMLLDLTAAREEHRRVSVTSLCIASAVPPTTALRWISQMVEQGLFVRISDKADRRRAFIELSDAGADAMGRYFTETGIGTHR